LKDHTIVNTALNCTFSCLFKGPEQHFSQQVVMNVFFS